MIGRNGMSQSRQVRARALGSSAMTVALMLAGPAFAQCTPDPTVSGTTTICSGTDADGLIVSTRGTTVVINQDATVSGANGEPGIDVRIQSANNGGPVTLTVNGLVNDGVFLNVDPIAGDTNAHVLALTVATGGQVNDGVALQRISRQSNAASASIDNSGVIGASAFGVAVSSDSSDVPFTSIVNRAGGTINSISAPIGTLDNAGTIVSAERGINAISQFGNSSSTGIINNSGTIRSTDDFTPTVSIDFFNALNNNGTIENLGAEAAISALILTINNNAAGRITSAGTTAITVRDRLNLTNAGTIVGDVLAGGTSTTSGSTVDSSAGQITGSLLFGAGNDTLIAAYDGTQLRYGVAGAIDGGAGTDSVRLRFTTDATIATPLTLPTAFERFSLIAEAGTTTTLAASATGTEALAIGGGGTIVNNAVLTTLGQVIANDLSVTGTPGLTNNGTIALTTTRGTPYAIDLTRFSRFENNGTIDSARNAVSLGDATTGAVNNGVVVNNGTVNAYFTGMRVTGDSFTNSATGVIQSSNGIALALTGGATGTERSNAGRIDGQTGARLTNTLLVNTGTIQGTQTGMVLGGTATLDNRAGGVVSGPTAISGRLSGIYTSNNIVTNAGTINGNVVFADLTDTVTTTSTRNRYFALPGGVLNGDLTLGRGDVLVTDFVNTGTGAFAGINGQVFASRSTLRLRVRADATTTLAERDGFTSLGYDLSNDAKLTVSGTSDQTLLVAGHGTVDLSGNITTVLRAAIQTISPTLAPGETATANALNITSSGDLSLLRIEEGNFTGAAVMLQNGDRFTNSGTISVTDRADLNPNEVAAISGAAVNTGSGSASQITNSGRISLSGAIGIRDTGTIVNTGTISQLMRNRTSVGVLGSSSYATTLTNSGTINVGGVAVQADTRGMTIANSGRISSFGGLAIALGGFSTIDNAATGTIAGGLVEGQTERLAIRTAGGRLTNAGTITGTVDMGYATSGRSFTSATYIQDGGTIDGNLLFGNGNDTLIAYNPLSINGTIDGGGGIDTLIQARRASDTVTISPNATTNFERQGVSAIGADTVVTLRAIEPITGSVALTGDGAIVNTATIESATLGTPDQYTNRGFVYGTPLNSFSNQGTITASVEGKVRQFANTGTIGGATINTNRFGTVEAVSNDTLDFTNSGSITTSNVDLGAVFLSVEKGSALTASNSGTITGGTDVRIGNNYLNEPISGSQSLSFINTGTMTSADTNEGETLALSADNATAAGSTITFDNKGLIEITSPSSDAVSLRGFSGPGTVAITATNSGTIRANAGERIVEGTFDPNYTYILPSVGLFVGNYSGGTTQLTNTASGVIEATGTQSVAVAAAESALDLVNAGTIRGGAGTRLTDVENSSFAYFGASDYLAGAIQTSDEDTGFSTIADRIINNGTIIGSINVAVGDDRIENYGRIEGDVFLGAGNDTFLHRLSATLIGTVDAGEGDDNFIVDATGGGTLNGDQFINFERFSQTGSGDVRYTGNFRLNTIDLVGGTISVAAGQTLTSSGAFTITGSDAIETVVNDGTIAGGITLGGGNDRVVNRGTIGGTVLLGDGDDSFVDGPNSTVAGGVDGGAGTDSYNVVLAGDRNGINARTNFERLSLEGTGTLTLALDQSFQTTTLTGTGLNTTLNGFSLGTVTGSDAAEQLMVDGDVASVALGAGNDMLATGAQTAAGSYDGGTGSDTLAFINTGVVILTGTATGFEQVALTNGSLTVAGTLGATNAPLSFGDGAQVVTVASGGTLAGVIDLGAGNDALRLTTGSTLNGTVAGGAGSDSVILTLAGDRSLASTTLTGFETFTSEGTGTLTLTGAHAYDALNAGTSLTIASGSTLTAPVRFGSGDQRFTIAGGFTGAVDGGAGSDTLAITGGNTAFSTVTNVEALAMSGGFATVSGTATLGSVDLTGGRLVGLAGSVLNGTFAVRSGATFGSAGTVNGNVTVAGILSPGASPGTMTVNGNVSLASGSTSVFEFTPTAQDKLVINGTLAIASGSTLQLTQSGTLRPGASYDLITASGGITGSFTTIQKPDTLFGFVVQRTDRIQLLGQFLNDAGFSPQVSRSVDYANTVLQTQPATSALFAVLPALTTSGGGSNAQAFARLTPEAYASATQIGVENALALTDIARGPGFAANRSEAGGFTFGQAIGSWYRLAADRSEGVSRAATNSYGFVGGIGYGDSAWSVGAFTGFINSRQRIDALAARTGVDGWVAGVHGRYATGKLGFGASIAYHGGKADTDRALPARVASRASYDLTSVVGDLSTHYTIDMGEWALRPRAGVTYIRTSRDQLVEAGGPFALTVAADKHVASFADAGVGFARAETSDAAFRPFVSLGLRYQIEGQRADAVAGYAGGPLGLVALGAGRAQAVGTVAAGLVQRVTDGLDLFSTASAQTGSSDNRAAISTGVRLRF
ncbi:autotransporter outer membrane beta-barrel domain-containing protein [Sphingomonas sp. SAFR-052]|uniref:autotransporter outer membrane beta-barrel domain-containing protein n=1 Tax=Sphingomonas sp. SAFR-052 TaxID=3436867 RepID=UPI003F7E4651